MSYPELAKARNVPHELMLIAPHEIETERPDEVANNAILVSSSRSTLGFIAYNFSHLSFLQGHSFPTWPEPPADSTKSLLKSLTGAVIEAVSTAWGVAVDSVLINSSLEQRERRVVKTHDGIDVTYHAYLLRRPT